MWLLTAVRAEPADQAEAQAIQAELQQILATRPWVMLFPNCVALDAFGPADLDLISGLFEQIATRHAGRFFYVAVFQPTNTFPRLRPRLPFNKAAFLRIVGAGSALASAPTGEEFTLSPPAARRTRKRGPR